MFMGLFLKVVSKDTTFFLPKNEPLFFAVNLIANTYCCKSSGL
jgi:hypothetical protein